MSNDASGVIWRRLKYMLSPQLDCYKHISERVVGMDVLDIGFGTGFGTVQLASRARIVRAIEIDPSSVAFAKGVFPLPNITWEQGDIIGYRSAQWSAIVCLEVLEHVPDWRSALESMASLLSSDGTLYISGPNANANLRKNDIHEREWTAKEFVDALHGYFEDVNLVDYSLTETLGEDTRRTPLLALCRNPKSQNSI